MVSVEIAGTALQALGIKLDNVMNVVGQTAFEK